MTARIFAVGAAVLFLLTVQPSYGQRNAGRTWTSSDGLVLQGQLISATDGNVVIKVKGGQSYEFPLTRLSEADQKYVAELSAKGLTVKVGKMPAETRIANQVEVDGGPEVFTTEHFEFHADQKVSKAFISEAARVYEGTYQALSELPVGLKMRPPKDMDRFRGLFLSRSAFQDEINKFNQGNLRPAGRVQVAGVYIPGRKELLVPYSSLGALNNGSQKTLRKSSDTSTLVHEVVHQVMHDYLPLMPLWFTEGFAEYLNAVPYQNGRFEFKNLERGLKEHLKTKYGMRDGRVEMYHPADIMALMTERFPSNNVIGGYQDSMLLFIYLMHFDRPDAVGAPIAAFLNIFDVDNFDPNQFIEDYNAAVRKFNVDLVNYNNKLAAYDSKYSLYEIQFAKYDQRIAEINQAIERGVAEDKLPKELPAPVAPKAPEEFVVPAILKDHPNGPADVFAMMHTRATMIVTRDRSAEVFAQSLKKAYADIGIDIRFRQRATKDDAKQ